MRIAFFNPFAGISGDMTVGALLDAGADFVNLMAELEKLDLDGYRLEKLLTQRHHISATKFNVGLEAGGAPSEVNDHDHGHEHGHDHHNHGHSHGHTHDHSHDSGAGEHHHRGLTEIRRIIERSALGDRVKRQSVAIFTRLGEAEAKMHDTTVDEVHFHEVGAVDAIVDIVGACIALESLGVEEVYSTPVRLGRGQIRASHGMLPVPAPATVELLRGIPVEYTEIPFEMTTPTGAAIISTLATSFAPPPPFAIDTVGYGAGGRDTEHIANLLRVQIGETAAAGTALAGATEEQMVMLETNIDSMNPEIYGHVMEQLLDAGARDVFLTSVMMKKNRPGTVLSVLSKPRDVDRLTDILFRETPTLGIRTIPHTRRVLPREAGEVETEWGAVRVKTSHWAGRARTTPEFDDCARIAREHGVPIADVYEAVRRALATE